MKTINLTDIQYNQLLEYANINNFNLTEALTQLLNLGSIKKYNDETIKVMEEVENNIGLSREFTSIKDLMDDLNA